MSKETIKKKTKKQDDVDEFMQLAKEIKEIVVSLNQRVADIEAINNKIKARLGI